MNKDQILQLYKNILDEYGVTTPTEYEMLRLLDALMLVYLNKPMDYMG